MASINRANNASLQLIHKPMHRAWFSIVAWAITLVASLTICFLLGCGEPTSTAIAESTSNASATSGPMVEMRDKLVGVWLGEAYLDREELVKRLENLPQDQVDSIVRQADYFIGTVMAIDFRPDGSLENQIEISPTGTEPISQQGFGTWRIVELQDEGAVVEIAEKNPDGSITTSRKAYRFYEDGEHFAVSIPLETVLSDCSPMIVFEKQYLDEPEGIVAEAAASSQRK